MLSRALALVCLWSSLLRFEPFTLRFALSHVRDVELIRYLSTCIPTYIEARSEPEQYQKTFEPPYSSRPASRFLLVSFSKVTRHRLRVFLPIFVAESLPKKANDYAGFMSPKRSLPPLISFRSLLQLSAIGQLFLV